MKHITIIGLVLLLLTSCSTPKEIITHDTIHYVNEHYNTIYDSVFIEHKNKEKMKNDTMFIYDSTTYHHYHYTHDTILNDTTIYINTKEVVEDKAVVREMRLVKLFNITLLAIIAISLTYLACKRLKILR